MTVVLPAPDGPNIKINIFCILMKEQKKTTQQSLDLGMPLSDRAILPSPKRTRQDLVADGEMPWGLAYAAFSRSFASAAISELKGATHLIIVDPFVGSGTTVEASLENGCSCIGIDLNPYSALTSRVRGVKRQSIEGVQRILDSLKTAKAQEDDLGKDQADPVALLIGELGHRLKVNKTQVVQEICSRKSNDFDDELIALCSITYAARLASNLSRGSNPTWPQNLGGEIKSERGGLVKLAEQVSSHMLESLRAQTKSGDTFTQVFNSDFASARLLNGSIKRFLTSPPYLNRLDYVRSNLPEIQRLTTSDSEQVEDLRSRMMGTTKIRGMSTELKAHILSSLTANAVIEEIRCHPTKASGTYYFQFFLQYFLDLERFFRWLSLKTCIGAVGMIVLQNSYYKDLPIPLVDIYQEMAEIYGFRSKIVAEWKKSNHIGQMSPTQRKHAPGKVLTESVVLLEKICG